MRTAFVNEVARLARTDKDVMLLTGDLGFSVFEGFMQEFPKQYLNIGVAEQNLIGVAAGLALGGKKVFAYSITTFASMRGFEQVRDDVAYQKLPVTIVGAGSTFSYSMYGGTHQPIEDLGIMRLVPNMRVLCPGDPHEVTALVRGVYEHPGPAYIRVSKRGEPKVHNADVNIRVGEASEIMEGSDVTLIAMGRPLPDVVQAAELLEGDGISACVLSSHTLKPFDEKGIARALAKTHAVVTVEDHNILGGLGTAVSEVVTRNAIVTRLTMMGIPDEFPKGVGTQAYFLEKYSMTPEGIADAAKRTLRS